MRAPVLVARTALAVLATATLLAAHAAGAPGGAAVRPVDALTPAQLQSLPDATKVQLNHRTVTLGTLRAAHTARQARFEDASASGARSARKAAAHKKAAAYVPMPRSALAPYAKDYQDFCAASKATGCLYVPTGVSLVVSQGVARDLDPLITSAAVCASGGGKLYDGVFGKFCSYAYPMSYVGNFVTTATKATTDCPFAGIFKTTFDPHGAVDLTLTLNTDRWNEVKLKSNAAAVHCTILVPAR